MNFEAEKIILVIKKKNKYKRYNVTDVYKVIEGGTARYQISVEREG